MPGPQTFAITGFFQDTQYDTPDTRFERGATAQEAVANLVTQAGDFKLLAIVSKRDLVSILDNMTTWEKQNHVRT